MYLPINAGRGKAVKSLSAYGNCIDSFIFLRNYLEREGGEEQEKTKEEAGREAKED